MDDIRNTSALFVGGQDTAPHTERTARELWQLLFQKTENEMAGYMNRLDQLSRDELIQAADEISAMMTCHSELMAFGENLSRKKMIFLLQQEKPLELLSEAWMEHQTVDVGETFQSLLTGLYDETRQTQVRDMVYAIQPKTVLCKSLVVGWSIERSEHSNSKCGPWISPVREFGRYLRSMGDLDAYVLEYPVSQNSFRPEVYLLSDIEIQRFFKECDSYVLRKKTPGRPYVYPALYRFLYCCGARCGEARHLRCENVHLSDGYLDILQSKGHRDRRLFLSDELISYLIEYDCAIRNCFPKREYFFPGPSGNIISASSIPFNFRKIWLAAGLKRDGEIKPRPYDFRHHFACANIARWAKERKDVISMLPYLMRYMGHSSLEKTYYYVHLIPDYFADYAAATENLESLLPEVEPYEI